jgi:hypothetical protein
MALKVPTALKPVTDFGIQVAIGAIAFTLVALVAVVLSCIVDLIEFWRVAPLWLIQGLHWLEWVLFWTDAFCFGLFLVSEVIKLARGLWREMQ